MEQDAKRVGGQAPEPGNNNRIGFQKSREMNPGTLAGTRKWWWNKACFLEELRTPFSSRAVCGIINPCVIPNSLEDFGMFLYRNPPELRLLYVPEPSRTSSAICPATLRNLISFLVRNPPAHQLSAPEPSGTSSAFCTGTLQNLVCYLHWNLVCYMRRNHPEPHQPSAPEPAGT